MELSDALWPIVDVAWPYGVISGKALRVHCGQRTKGRGSSCDGSARSVQKKSGRPSNRLQRQSVNLMMLETIQEEEGVKNGSYKLKKNRKIERTRIQDRKRDRKDKEQVRITKKARRRGSLANDTGGCSPADVAHLQQAGQISAMRTISPPSREFLNSFPANKYKNQEELSQTHLEKKIKKNSEHRFAYLLQLVGVIFWLRNTDCCKVANCRKGDNGYIRA